MLFQSKMNLQKWLQKNRHLDVKLVITHSNSNPAGNNTLLANTWGKNVLFVAIFAKEVLEGQKNSRIMLIKVIYILCPSHPQWTALLPSLVNFLGIFKSLNIFKLILILIHNFLDPVFVYCCLNNLKGTT